MNISVITCTHNPDKNILQRVFHAVEHCITAYGSLCEYCVVDNKSLPPITELEFVKNFLKRNTWAKVIQEGRPGLSYAREAGIGATTGDIIVFFDDDNEPAADYLVNADALMRNHFEVGCWGPGRVQVEFLAGRVHPWVNTQKSLFQERFVAEQKTTNSTPPDYLAFPSGTGLVLRRNALQFYLQNVENGKYTMTDRKGRSLASGGDTQIVLQAIRNKWAVGISPMLQLNHLISSQKTQLNYALRLTYVANTSLIMAYNEVFPENSLPFRATTSYLLLKQVKWFLQALRKQHTYNHSNALFGVIKQVAGASQFYIAYPEHIRPFLICLFDIWFRC